ncbi:MAG: tRNA (adenosine(37)-N6)-dimethylallyltransferase MiaA [Peptostreptococcaceae bacterium]|nr:tRNA (adenosine(37)-N6)-dimethylallyltransferase MiaA [Peptostreptococcaceae bacterium]
MVNIYVIAGPTATGKTKVAIELAKRINGEIVSCDSMQLYKYMNIGSAKPTKEELEEVKHHLIGVVDPSEFFTVAKYQKLAYEAIDDIVSRGKTPVVVGGTGLYLNSLIYEMDFAAKPLNAKRRIELESMSAEVLYAYLSEINCGAAGRIHPNNKKKVIRAIEATELGKEVKPFEECNIKNQAYDFKLYGLNWDRKVLYERINQRVENMISEGLVDEVKHMFSLGLTCDNFSMKGIGYKEIIEYLNGNYNLEDAIYLIKRNTRHFAKRQQTWFKKYEDMIWIDVDEDTEVADIVEKIL